MPLTDAACRTATCPPDKARLRLTDTGSLYLEVSPAGSKRWFWKYYFNGKEKRLALGRYSDAQSPHVIMSLRDAREARDKAREEHRTGVDPVQRRRLEKLTRSVSAETTFAAVAREFHAVKLNGWSKQYGERWIERMEKDLFPWIGGVPLKEITAPLLLQALRRIESRGAHETAHTLRQTAGQVFRYGVATGRCDANPAPHLYGALRPIIVKHMAAVLEPAAAGSLLRAIWAYEGQPLTRAALQLSALTFQRPGNIRELEWHEIDFDTARWTIPAAKMKRTVQGKESGRPHLVPLAPQAIEVLREVEPLTGHGRYVFTSLLSGARPMSENTLRAALRRLGYSNDDMTPHGFRAMARTIMVEQLNVHADVIEAQLAHEKSGPLGAAYDRAEFVAQRCAMMNEWANYLESLRDPARALSNRTPKASRRGSGVRSSTVSTR